MSLVLIVSMLAPWQAFAVTYDDPFHTTRGPIEPQYFGAPAPAANGAFSYSIPLSVPPGRGANGPKLQLTYSSSPDREGSALGYGWSLNIPYIERINKIGVDRLYNQDLAHTFFISSLSGEILPIATSTPVVGSFLSYAVSLARQALLPLRAWLDLSTSTAVDPLPPLPDLSASPTQALPEVGTAPPESLTTTPSAATSSPQQQTQPTQGQSPVWAYSQERVQYDTANGELHPGEYARQPDGQTYIAYLATTTITTATSTYIVPPHLAGFATTSALVEMTEVHEIGRKYIDAFSDGVSVFTLPSTKASYFNLDKAGAVTPTYTVAQSTVAVHGVLVDLMLAILKSVVGLKTAEAAIFNDNAASFSSCGSGTSCTYSYAATSSASTALVCNTSSYNVLPGTVTMSYAGSPMAEVGTQQVDTSAGNNYVVDTFSLANTATGTNNLVITTQNSISGFYAHCSSYTGVDPLTPIETSGQHAVGYANCTSDNTTLTTSTDGAWLVGLWGDDAGRTHTAGAGTPRTSDGQGVIIDTGPITPAGSATVTNVPSAGTGCPATGIVLLPLVTGAKVGALQVELQSNPSWVATSNPRFSAQFVDAASTTELATSYQIQVTTSSSSWSSPYWDSGQQTLASSTPAGGRTPQLFATTTFPLDLTKYYWRIRLWNQVGSTTPWSAGSNTFTMGGSINYGAKVESGDFMRYTRLASLGSETWFAYDKSGTRYTFGNASTSRVSDANTGNAFRWMLDSTLDPNGNSTSYSYATDSGQVYPTRIVYTGNATSATVGEVDFVYESRSDIATSSAPGFQIVTKKRLAQVLIYTNGRLTHSYKLTYSTGANGARSVLTGLQESGWSASSGTTTLPAYAFTYASASTTWALSGSGWTLPGDFVNGPSHDMGYRFVDVNGDALPDIVYGYNDNTTSSRAVYLNTGSDWALSSDWTNPVDFSRTQIDQGIRFADVNGDGLADIVQGYCVSGGACTLKTYINNATSTWTASSTWTPPGAFIDDSGFDQGSQLVDVNGDGLPDFIRSYNNGASPNNVDIRKVYINTGAGWVEDTSWVVPVDFVYQYDQGVRLADVNGDGLTDIIQAYGGGSGTYALYLSNGHGWTLEPEWNMPTYFGGASTDFGTRLVDVDGDGLIDVVRRGGTTNHWWRNSGSRFTDISTSTIPEDIAWDTTWYGVYPEEDVNGDGLSDVVRSDTGTRRIYLKNGTRSDLLTQIVNPTGGSTQISYQASPLYTANSRTANPRLPFVQMTVRTVAQSPGFGGTTSTTTYVYAGGEYYGFTINDRQFAGFASTTQTNSAGNVTHSYFHQGNSSDSSNGEYNDNIGKAGKAYRVEDLDAGGNLFTRTVNKWARADYGDGRNFVKLVQSLKQTFDGDSSHRDTAASTTYNDTTGDPILRDDWGEVNGSGDGTFADVGNDAASTTWSYAASSTLATSTLSLPSRELVNDQSGAVVRDSKWYYDGLTFGQVAKGNRTKEERLKSGSSYASTTRTYDAYGNVLTSSDGLGNLTTFVYDAFNLYPATSTNALGQSTTFAYDYATGRIATTTDANGRVFVTKYDGLGRSIEEDQPDFTTPTTLVPKTKYTYTDSTTSPSSVLRQDYLNAATTSDLYTYLDGLGRTIQSKKEAEPANGWTTSDTIYNAIGQVGSQSFPYFSASSNWSAPTSTWYLLTNTSYDAESRPTTITDSVGTTTNTYNDWTLTVTDPLGNKKDYVKDAWGNLAQVVEYLSPSSATTTYTWNRLAKLTKLTDAAGNVRNFTYDTLGRLLTAEDLHAPAHSLFGTSTYTYDDAGNIVTFLNPRNQTTNYTFDKLNRALTEDYTGGAGTEVSYSYDSGTNGVGRLSQAVYQSNATTTYAYNPIGFVTSESKLIAGSWGTTTKSYLRSGAVDTIIYPDASQVGQIYDNAGLLETILEKEPGVATTTVVSAIGYAPTGDMSVVKYANGVTATSTFDATKKYRLTVKSAQGPTLLQNLAYSYDAAGNITQLADSASSSARKSVNYTYDKLYRLLSASTTLVATGTSQYAQTFAYDALGNITSGPSGTYSYAATGYANPDAATAIGAATYSYDQAGNLLSNGTLTNTWDYHSFLALTQIGGGSSVTATATPAYVQSKLVTVQGSTTNSVTLTNAVTTGDLIVVGITVNHQTVATNTISDNFGNTYTKAAEAIHTTNDDHAALFYAKNVTGGSSFRVTSNIGDNTLSVHEYSGVSTSSPLDKIATAIGTSTTPNSGNVTTATSSELFFGLAWSRGHLDTWTAGSGYTKRQEQLDDNAFERQATEDKTVVATTSSASFTTSSSAAWAAVLATFKPLVTTSGSASSTSTYRYDQAGNRVYLQDSATTTRYWSTLYQDTPGAYKKTKNIYANGLLIATLEKTGSASATPYYVVSDHLGGANVITNASGAATETLDYYPYGATRIDQKQATFSEPRKYIGQVYDDATSLSYLNARYYNGSNGQFISQDPILAGAPDGALMVFPQAMNFYSYSTNNPITKEDPSGKLRSDLVLANYSGSSFPEGMTQGTYLGVPITSNGANNGTLNAAYSCVTFVKNVFAKEYPGLHLGAADKPGGTGTGADYGDPSTAPNVLGPNGKVVGQLSINKQGSSVMPRQGDIVSYGGEGHVAIISEVDQVTASSWTVYTVEQNQSARNGDGVPEFQQTLTLSDGKYKLDSKGQNGLPVQSWDRYTPANSCNAYDHNTAATQPVKSK